MPRERSTPWPATPASSATSARCTTSSSATSRAPAGSRPATALAPLRTVAYFSPEFGIAEALPQYSGGLGVLAGDHLKAASDLGVPLVGVGLLYRHGYFRQALNPDGWQQERYPDLDPYAMALTPLRRRAGDGRPGRRSRCVAQVWRADVGRIPLYLLDADVEDNHRRRRQVTDRLYGGDTEHRLRQEILLGIGGVRALDALGIDAQVFHTNEGHAGFLGLERMRRCVVDDGLSLRRGGRGGAGRVHLHHPHAGAGRHRPLPARAHGATTSRRGPRSAASASTSSWPSATAPTTEPTSASTWR